MSGEASIEDVTIDGFLGGQVVLVQPRNGHRAGLDAALLQAVVPKEAKGTAVELGTGVGSVAFALAARAPAISVIAVDNDPAVLRLAQAGLSRPENASIRDRVALVLGDAYASPLDCKALGLPGPHADWALMNPPFDEVRSVTGSPYEAKRSAYLARPGELALWIRSAAALLARGGRLGLIHRAAALPVVLEGLGDQFGDVQVLPVVPRSGEPARRIVVRAIRGRKTPLRLLSPFVLHLTSAKAAQGWTETAQQVLSGEAGLPFLD